MKPGVPYHNPSPSAWRWLALIVAAHIALGVLFATLVPPLEKLDEFIHWDYVRYLRREGHLPDQRDPYIQNFPAEFHQPPLYYIPAALITAPIPFSDPPLSWEPYNSFGFAFILSAIPDNANGTLHDPAKLAFPWHGDWLALHVLRFYSVLISAVGLIAMFWLAWAIFQDEGLALGTSAWLAFRPSLLSINSTVSNDPLLLTLGTWVLAACALIIVRGPTWKRSIGLGVLLGLTALTKFTWPATALAVPLAYLLAPSEHVSAPSLPTRRITRLPERLAQLAAAGGIAIVLVGWWFARNLILYGDLTGIDLGGRADRPDFLPLRTAPPTWQEAGRVAWETFRRYWAHYGVVGMPDWVNYSLLILSILLVLGLLMVLIARRLGQVTAQPRAAIFTLIVTLLYLGQIGVLFMVNEHGGQVRYVYAGFGAMAILSQLGVMGWLTLLPYTSLLRRIATWLPTLIMLPLTIYGLFGVLRPAYDLPRRVSDPARLADQYDQPADVWFGETIHLIGFRMMPRAVHPGDTIFVNLCWESGGPLDEAIPYSVSVIDQREGKIGLRNTHPGLGMYATLYWEPGVYFCDRVRVPLSADAPAPQVYRVVLNYFHKDSLEKIPARLGNGTWQDLITLGEIAVLPERWPPVGKPLYLLGQSLAVTELDMNQAEGDSIKLRIKWQALTDIGSDYTAFVHVVDRRTGQLVTQVDTRPLGGRFPTAFWPAGAVVEDAIAIDLEGVPPGAYRVLFGMYESTSVIRLPVVTPEGKPLPDSVIEVGALTVEG